MGIYFLRSFITTAKHALMVEAVEYREKYMNICLIILMWEKNYMWKKHSNVLRTNVLEKKIH